MNGYVVPSATSRFIHMHVYTPARRFLPPSPSPFALNIHRESTRVEEHPAASIIAIVLCHANGLQAKAWLTYATVVHYIYYRQRWWPTSATGGGCLRNLADY